ncbi:MAG: efflux RND transporter periplasmic adaptor subunit [Candidatus Aminicenantes bacterium]|nr:efflux RND transporter periplasmic adaptor subunit [Candidatus Aminicenantes bacterium]
MRRKKFIELNLDWGLVIMVALLVLLFSNCQKKASLASAGWPDSSHCASSSEVRASESPAASLLGKDSLQLHLESSNRSPALVSLSSYSQEKSVVSEAKAKIKERKLYHCPMHPHYVSDKPGHCPICGMNLVLIEEEKGKGEERMTLSPGAIDISPEKQQLLGVTFGQVTTRELHYTVSAYGHLTYDETRQFSVTTKFSGWIEKLFVNYTGKMVRRGEPLFSIYSPELVAAQEEYLLALRAQKTLESFKNDLTPRQQESQENQSWASLVEAAKRRLLLWDISPAQIEGIEREAKPFRHLTIFSPVSGFIIEKKVVEGQFIMAGENLLLLVDLSPIWLIADIYEQDLPFICLGQDVSVEISSWPSETFRGRINFIYPYLEKENRTVKVRIDLPNPGYRLKPELYGRINIHLKLGKRLSIPEEAVIDSGQRKIVFVVREGRYFEPREIKLGLKAHEFYEVLTGLVEGEQIVTSAQFLIDSESRLKTALQDFHQNLSGKKPERHKHLH